MADDIRRELVFGDGGRPYNNLDFESIQRSINDAQQIFNQFTNSIDQNSWIINGVTAIAGEAVGQAGIVWINGKMRYLETRNPAAFNFNLFNPLYIGALTTEEESRLYKDGNVKAVFNLHIAQWLTESEKTTLGLTAEDVIELTSEEDIDSARFQNSALVNRLIVKQSANNTTKVNISGAVNLIGGSGLNVYKQDDETIVFKQGSVEGFPPGGIIMFSGSLSTFDANGTGLNDWLGWQLCNGLNNSPDLRDRFVVGSDMNYAAGGPLYTQGDTGGSNDVTLSTAQLPSHTHIINNDGDHDHVITINIAGVHSHSVAPDTISAHSHSGTVDQDGEHTHVVLVNNNSSASGTTSVDSHTHTYTSTTLGDVATGSSRTRVLNQTSATTNSDSHSHTYDLISHTHNASAVNAGIHTHTFTSDIDGSHSHTIEDSTSHTHTALSSITAHSHSPSLVGNDETHENRPPYFALAYVMKI